MEYSARDSMPGLAIRRASMADWPMSLTMVPSASFSISGSGRPCWRPKAMISAAVDTACSLA